MSLPGAPAAEGSPGPDGAGVPAVAGPVPPPIVLVEPGHPQYMWPSQRRARLELAAQRKRGAQQAQAAPAGPQPPTGAAPDGQPAGEGPPPPAAPAPAAPALPVPPPPERRVVADAPLVVKKRARGPAMGASGGQGAPAPTPRPVTLHLPMPLPMPPNALVLPGAADIPLLAQAAAARQDPEPHEVNGHPPPAVPEPPAPRGPVPPQPGPQPPKPRQPKRRRDRQPAPDRRVAVPPLAFPERADNEAGLRNLMVFYEAARKQIQAWGPEATWRIDLVLDPPAPSRAPTPPPEPLYHTLPGPPAPVPIPIPLGPTELLPPVDFPAPPTDPTLAHRIHLEAMPRALALESRPGARADPEMLGFAEWAVPWGEIVLPAAAEGRRGGVRGEEMLAYAQGEVRRLEAELEVTRMRALVNDSHHAADRAVLLSRLHAYAERCALLEREIRRRDARLAMGVRGGPVVVREPVPGAFAGGGWGGLGALAEAAGDSEGGEGWEPGEASGSEGERPVRRQPLRAARMGEVPEMQVQPGQLAGEDDGEDGEMEVAARLLARAAEHPLPPEEPRRRPPKPSGGPKPPSGRKSLRRTGWAEKAGAKVLKPDLPSGVGPKKMKKTGLLAKFERDMAGMHPGEESLGMGAGYGYAFAPGPQGGDVRSAAERMRERMRRIVDSQPGSRAGSEGPSLEASEEDEGEEGEEEARPRGRGFAIAFGSDDEDEEEERAARRARQREREREARRERERERAEALAAMEDFTPAGSGAVTPEDASDDARETYGYTGRTPPGSVIRRKKRREPRERPPPVESRRDMPTRAARPTFDAASHRRLSSRRSPGQESEEEVPEEPLAVVMTDEGPGVVIEEAFGVLDFDPHEVAGILTRRAEEEEKAREQRAQGHKRVKYT